MVKAMDFCANKWKYEGVHFFRELKNYLVNFLNLWRKNINKKNNQIINLIFEYLAIAKGLKSRKNAYLAVVTGT